MSKRPHEPVNQHLLREQISSCLTRRQRKLRELWAVTATSPATPLPDSFDQSNPDLLDFLEQNNLEKDRYFFEASLPDRAQREWTLADLTPPHESTFPAHEQLPDQAPSSATKARHAPELHIYTDAPSAPSADDDDQDELDATIPTPRSTLDHDRDQLHPSTAPQSTRNRHKEARLPPDKSSTPHSPPYSPHAIRNTPSSDAPAANIDGSVTEPVTTTAGKSLEAVSGAPGDGSEPVATQAQDGTDRVSVARDVPDHNVSSPSSTGDPKSADTSRAGGRSTATSPDQDAEPAREQERSRPAANKGPPPPEDLHMASSTTVATEPLKATSKPRDAERMSALFGDQHEHKRKRRRLQKDSFSVVMAKAGPPEKEIELVRALQRYTGADERVPSKKKDWMHLLFLQQAMNQTNGHKCDLSNLLESSNKVLSTSDWQAQFREKQDCAIIKRVYEWQQGSRWPLRQTRTAADFPTPSSHQDSLIAEMKWLQTDFREERKLKISVCADLAQSCHAWWMSTPSERAALQVQSNLKIAEMVLPGQDIPEDVNHVESEFLGESNEEETEPALSTFALSLNEVGGFRSEFHLGKDIASRLPLWEPWRVQSNPLIGGPRHVLTHNGVMGVPGIQPIGVRDTIDSTGPRPSSSSDIPPMDTSCALFQPEWEALRKRQQVPLAFKPPNASIPPSGFYEHRRASQWTEEEDKQLKAWAKDFPSNWSLIAERHNQKSQFIPAISRRTPWECYERLAMIMEGAAADPTTRQYAKQFQGQLERIRTRWQGSVQQQAQHAQNAGQQFVPPRFPTPVRVERKSSNKRFLGLVDAARKLAKKRESVEQTRKQSNHEAVPSAPKPSLTNKSEPSHTPEALSLLKFKRQLEHNEKAERIRQQQSRAAFLAQGRPMPGQSGSQQQYSAGHAQRLANSTHPGQAVPNAQTHGHLAVPGQHQQRPFSQQQGQQFQLPNGASNSQMQQMMINGQNQMNVQQHQRSNQPFNPSQQMSDQNLQQLMRQQSRNSAAFQAQRQLSNQSQFNRASPSMRNGTSGLNMVGQFNQHNAGADANQSPRAEQAGFAASNQASPNLTHPIMAGQQFPNGQTPQSQGHRQALSSGHVPAITVIQHQVAQQNPGLSEEELQQITNDKLNSLISNQQQQQIQQQQRAAANPPTAMERSRQNAINAATGLHGSLQQQQQQQQSRANAAQQAQGQGSYNAHAQASNAQQGTYNAQQNGVLGSNGAFQARSASPAGVPPNYSQVMRQTTSQQMRRNGVMSPDGGRVPASNHSGSATNSPALQRNTMQPPLGMSPGEAARPGSAQMAAPRLASQSPRPLSSQGQAAQG